MSLLSEEREAYSHLITRQLIQHPLFVRNEELYCYVSCKEEVSTRELMESSWQLGKKIAVPKVLGKNHMEFFYIDKMEELTPGFQGILEPDSLRQAKGGHGLILLPGLAFDFFGNRVGYGGGYYDAYLKKHPGLCRIGAAFFIQCFQTIPAEDHDIPVEAVVTEKGWIPICSHKTL